MNLTRNIKLLCFFGCMTVALSGALRRSSSYAMTPDAVLAELQQKILDATHNVAGFDETIPEILKEGAEKLKGDKERFEKLIFTIGHDGLTIITHLVIEFDTQELAESLGIIRDFFGREHKEIARLMRRQDHWGRSPLYFAVLRKKDAMIEALLKPAMEIFGHDKHEFVLFLNGESDEGKREITNYRTPFILVAYNDDAKAAHVLMESALDIFGRGSPEFQRFIQARDADGAVAGFYAGERVLVEAKQLCITLM